LDAPWVHKPPGFAVNTEPTDQPGADGPVGGPARGLRLVGFAGIILGIIVAGAGTAIGDGAFEGGAWHLFLGGTEREKFRGNEFDERVGRGCLRRGHGVFLGESLTS
jgi:hypothetical protein